MDGSGDRLRCEREREVTCKSNRTNNQCRCSMTRIRGTREREGTRNDEARRAHEDDERG